MRFENKVAVVTGGASGFGKGIVEKFINEGAKVLIADINIESAKELEKGFKRLLELRKNRLDLKS